MSTATSHLTVEEFHRLYDGVKPNHEYWFGEAVPKPMATILHGAVQIILGILLRARGWSAYSEVTLKLARGAEPIPDLVANRVKIDPPYPTKPFDLCIEIRSPQDSLKRLFEKGKYYLSWGVGSVWIIDPEARTAWMMTPEHPEGIWIHPDGSLTAGEGMVISLPELFAELDKELGA